MDEVAMCAVMSPATSPASKSSSLESNSSAAPPVENGSLSGEVVAGGDAKSSAGSGLGAGAVLKVAVWCSPTAGDENPEANSAVLGVLGFFCCAVGVCAALSDERRVCGAAAAAALRPPRVDGVSEPLL